MKTIYTLKFFFKTMGFDTHAFICFLKGFVPYLRDRRKLKIKETSADFPVIKCMPMLTDKYESGGTASGHYFHQDLWVAKRIYERNPRRHLDIGSRVDGFVAHVAVFREIEVIDIRPISNKVKNIRFVQADLLQIPESLYGSFDSVSSLHAIEHIGLGRYGDPVNPEGHLQAINQLYQLLEPNGTLYLSTPIGNQRIEFNAHRVFSIPYLLKHLSPMFQLKTFSYVNDKGDLNENITLTTENTINSCGCNFGCGIFELIKK